MPRKLLLITLALLSGCRGSKVPDPIIESKSWIAFVSNRSGNFDLYLVHPDGSELHVVAQSASTELFPNWSPDGKRLAFTSNRSGTYQIYSVDVATDVVTAIDTGVSSASTPAWSPDGTAIAFGGPGGLYLVSSAGGHSTQITSGNHRDSLPAWSTDGSLVYFSSDRSGTFDVWSVKPDGSELTQVTSGTRIVGGPAVSSGNQIIALAQGSGATQVVLWNLAAKTLGNFSSMNDYEPAFSGTGDELAVTTLRYGANNPEIVVLGVPDGGVLFRLTDDPAIDGQATFQPVP